jgi:hypothetical protein
MSDSMVAGKALLAFLKASLSPDTGYPFVHIVLYTSFGVVRGRTGLSFAQSSEAELQEVLDELIELNEVTVEHYSNHLPTASFEKFYVRLVDIQGFALQDSQDQN